MGELALSTGADVTISETSGAKGGYEELEALLRAGEPAVIYGLSNIILGGGQD